MKSLTSADRILAILDLFSEARLDWTPEEMMAELGYSRPTLYRYLRPLRQTGFLTSLPGGGYSLGPRVVEMDFLLRQSDPLTRHGQPYLDALVAGFPCSALLVRWYGEKLLCVASECSAPDPATSYPRGRPMPMARGAISRAIMAFLPRRKLLGLVAAQADELQAIGLGATAEEILEALREVRRAGVAVAHGEVTPGAVGIAAPVFVSGTAPSATLSVTVSETTLAPGMLDALQRRLRCDAATLSARLGHDRGSEGLPEIDTALTAIG